MDNRVERRQHPRYFIPAHTQVLASIRANGKSCLGKLVNLCEGGFLMTTECSTPTTTLIDWEIQYHDLTLQGTGKLERRGESMASISPDGAVDLAPLMALLKAAGYPMGAIVRKERTAVIKGVLDFETARHLLRRIRSGDREIDLSQCEDIDSSGLGVLLIAQKERVQLSGCHGKVMQIADMVGMCKHCPSTQECHPSRQNTHPGPTDSRAINYC